MRTLVYAAISSRNPGERGPGSRMISCVNCARCFVALGRNANMCQICGYSCPAAWIVRMASRYGEGVVQFSTLGRNMGFIGRP